MTDNPVKIAEMATALCWQPHMKKSSYTHGKKKLHKFQAGANKELLQFFT